MLYTTATKLFLTSIWFFGISLYLPPPTAIPTPLNNINFALPNNSCKLLNIGALRDVQPYNLPTINEGYYTTLVANLPKDERFTMDIPEHLAYSYNLGDQYVK